MDLGQELSRSGKFEPKIDKVDRVLCSAPVQLRARRCTGQVRVTGTILLNTCLVLISNDDNNNRSDNGADRCHHPRCMQRPYYAPGPRTLTTSFVLHCECVVRQSCSCSLCMMPVTVCMFRSLMPDIISSRSSLRGLSASAHRYQLWPARTGRSWHWHIHSFITDSDESFILPSGCSGRSGS